MDLGKLIRKRLAEALRRGPVNAASTVNVGRSGHTTAVYSDDAVTIVQRDGRTHIVRHDGGSEDPSGR